MMFKNPFLRHLFLQYRSPREPAEHRGETLGHRYCEECNGLLDGRGRCPAHDARMAARAGNVRCETCLKHLTVDDARRVASGKSGSRHGPWVRFYCDDHAPGYDHSILRRTGETIYLKGGVEVTKEGKRIASIDEVWAGELLS